MSKTMNHEKHEKHEKRGKTLVPQLRFPEFRKKLGWGISPLGQQFSERQEKGYHDLPLLSLMDKEGIVPQEESNRKNNSNSDKSKYLRVVPGDIAYNTMRMWEGRSAHVGIEGLVSPAYTVCMPTAGINSLFFSYYFKTEPLIGQFRRYSQGLVKDTLNLKYEPFSRIPVASPSPPEQQKIANCLTSLDGLIATEGRMLEALKAHKKGLMQQLFPQPGQTQPRLRFPEFIETRDWFNELLEELADRGSGHTPDKKKPEYYNGGIKWVSLADSKRLDQGLISETAIEIAEQGLKNSSAVLHPAGSVILSRDAGVGKSAVLAEQMAVSQHFIVWKCNPRKLSNWYLYYLLQKLKPLLEDIATGSTIKTIGLPFFKALRITVPRVDEQHRIADCLTALDTRIAAQAEKIDALKQHKRGLMQRLFPAPEAI